MKKFTFAATAAVAAVMLFACGNGSPKASLRSDIDTVSYAIGMAQTSSSKVSTKVQMLVMTRRRLLIMQVFRLVSRSATRW